MVKIMPSNKYYTPKLPVMRICRHCAQIFIVKTSGSGGQRRQCCFKGECEEKEEKRRVRLIRYWQIIRKAEKKKGLPKPPPKHRKPDNVYYMNKKIKKTCMQCRRTYWDYGPCHFGRCPTCKGLDVYGEVDWGTI